MDLSIKDIYIKEKEAHLTRSKFQEVLILMQKANVPDFPLLSYSEQLRGEMALKVWETNLEVGKKSAREVKEACLETLSPLNKKMIEF
jgi:hypothetical protein